MDDQRAAVDDVLLRLPDDMKTVIELRNKEGLSFTEIGASMRCSSDAARKLWARGIERMQQLLLNGDDQR
jgi:DNA-directed RNA polymerase specialized sigma24 family protein